MLKPAGTPGKRAVVKLTYGVQHTHFSAPIYDSHTNASCRTCSYLTRSGSRSARQFCGWWVAGRATEGEEDLSTQALADEPPNMYEPCCWQPKLYSIKARGLFVVPASYEPILNACSQCGAVCQPRFWPAVFPSLLQQLGLLANLI
eukprot:1148089-Pelagomonas_calceolata.AAC.4